MDTFGSTPTYEMAVDILSKHTVSLEITPWAPFFILSTRSSFLGERFSPREYVVKNNTSKVTSILLNVNVCHQNMIFNESALKWISMFLQKFSCTWKIILTWKMYKTANFALESSSSVLKQLETHLKWYG